MTYQLRRISDRDGYGNTPTVIIIKRQSTIIGRASSKTPPNCVIESELNPMMVSRKHAELRAEERGNRFFLVDHSLNGTYINYTRILSSKLLFVNDIICFGHVNGYNIKAGSTVAPFRSELKFVFEKLSDVAPSLINDAVEADDDAAAAADNRKRRYSSSADQTLAKQRRRSAAAAAAAATADISDSSSFGSGSDAAPAQQLPLPPSLPPPPAPASEKLEKKKTSSSAAASASRTSSGKSTGGSSNRKSQSSSSSASRPAAAAAAAAGGGAATAAAGSHRSSNKSKSSRSKPSSSSASALKPPKASSSEATTAQFHIDGEPCASLTCIKPKDPNVNWVCCDACNSWYHVMCTDLDDDVDLDEVEFFCIKCRD